MGYRLWVMGEDQWWSFIVIKGVESVGPAEVVFLGLGKILGYHFFYHLIERDFRLPAEFLFGF